jgi:FlaA1/EpsC-like NDP-sugar epimerase
MINLKKYKKLMLFIVDVLIILVSYILALLLRFDFNIPLEIQGVLQEKLPVIFIIYLLLFYFLGMYRNLWTVAGLEEYMNIVFSNILASAIILFFGYFIGERLPGSIIIISSTIILLGTLGFRILFRIYRRLGAGPKNKSSEGYKKVLIIGAGDAAALIIKEIRNHTILKIKIVGLVDDDEFKQNSYISGYPVL